MNAHELRLDYFKIYDVMDYRVEYQVTLQGQFDREGPETADLLFLKGFANPARKNGEPLKDPNAHLTWYELYQPTLKRTPTRSVVVENQFGRQEISTGWPRAVEVLPGTFLPVMEPPPVLLAPAQKGEEGEFPVDLDHFRLYWVVKGEPVGKGVARVTLEDQFGKEEVGVTYPIALGVPVQKTYRGEVSPIHDNRRAHLVVYHIERRPLEPPPTIAVRDQFGPRYLSVRESIALAVPSWKLEWEEL